MILSETKAFKYNGRKYMIFETDFKRIPSCKINKPGCCLTIMNNTLSERKRQLELHRLINGRCRRITLERRRQLA